MQLSFFPKGLYHIKNVKLKCKRPNNNQQQDPYAIDIILQSKQKNNTTITNNSQLWDITAFRPNILTDTKFIENMDTNGVPAIIFYENIEADQHYKIPRYILIGDTWFVNVR